ncbi:MAG: diaminopimelate epimerase [Acidithiobacillus sp.]|uniref:diaminopimelate epimerase n=1 Tax=Acidithiobacillus sp. TaxID=1872118 RepID=UPI003CFE670F
MATTSLDAKPPVLRFTKMEGLGNDFVVFDGVRQRVVLRPEDIRALADRHFGIGCDQVLLVEPSGRADCDFRYRIFNADGAEVEQCGNGARCFALFVRRAGLSAKRDIPVETRAGRLELHMGENGQVTVDMGVPQLEPAAIPFRADHPAASYILDVEGQAVSIAAVGMGNPHALLLTKGVDSAPVSSLGPKLERHPAFPRHSNVGFMEIDDRQHLRLRVWERGAGETLACGSNACAAVVAGQGWGLLDETVWVTLPGGALEIRWQGPGTHLYMTGPARAVFDGVWSFAPEAPGGTMREATLEQIAQQLNADQQELDFLRKLSDEEGETLARHIAALEIHCGPENYTATHWEDD